MDKNGLSFPTWHPYLQIEETKIWKEDYLVHKDLAGWT